MYTSCNDYVISMYIRLIFIRMGMWSNIMEEMFQTMRSQIGTSFVDPAKHGSRRFRFVQRSIRNCRWHCGEVSVYVYAIHINKWTELNLILVNTNRGPERLHHKFASGTLNNATWQHVSVTKHADKSSQCTAETYEKKISVTVTPEFPREETLL
jgi:hypothetical protein